jgi:hypothetical protein
MEYGVREKALTGSLRNSEQAFFQFFLIFLEKIYIILRDARPKTFDREFIYRLAKKIK